MFFFFQAEDGIRDIGVTGVQTCALPILRKAPKMGRGVNGYWRSSNNPCSWSRSVISCSWMYRRIIASSSSTVLTQIGRASCRERVEISVVAVSLKKKTHKSHHVSILVAL